MCHRKRKLTINFRSQIWYWHPQSTGSRTLFYPISIMPQILIEDSGNLKHPKNVKSISNTTVSHLVSCRLILRPATMMG